MPSTSQLLLFVLRVVFIALGLLSDSAYAMAGSGIGAALRRSVRARRDERYLSSGVYVGLGVTTAIAGGPPLALSWERQATDR